MLDTMKYATEILGMTAIWLCFSNSKNETFKTWSMIPTDSLRGGNVDLDEGIEDGHVSAGRTSSESPKAGPSSFIIQVNGQFSESGIYSWLRMLKPAIVHHQGAMKTEVENVCTLLRIPLLSGYHFWHGLVVLDPVYGNTRILEHAASHRPDPLLETRLTRPWTTTYVASQFMHDVVARIAPRSLVEKHVLVISPLSASDKMNDGGKGGEGAEEGAEGWIDLIKKDQTSFKGDLNRGYVTLINVHESKGGRLLLFLLQRFPLIPFLGIRTDTCRTVFDEELDRAIGEHKMARLIGRVEDVRSVYKRSSIILQPSEVDETFCRVVVEACASGVPLLCSDYGNIPNLLITEEAKTRFLVPSGPSRLETYQRWSEMLESMYHVSTPEHNDLSKVAFRNFCALKRQLRPASTFCRTVNQLVTSFSRRKRNVALLTPFCDQGLGIQNRNYARLLVRLGYQVYVFAFCPYSRTKQQAEPREWVLPSVHVVESPHVREEVTREELVDFVTRYHIDIAILAETCWDPVFTMMTLLRAMGVSTIAVPNVEILRRDEIDKHVVFDAIVCNNHACEDVFLQHGFEKSKLFYSGYHIEPPLEGEYSGSEVGAGERMVTIREGHYRPLTQIIREVRFLILGGMNATSRKHVHVVAEAFLNAQAELLSHPGRSKCTTHPKMFLTATSQKSEADLLPIVTRLASGGGGGGVGGSGGGSRGAGGDQTVRVIMQPLSKAAIDELYDEADVVIQVSKQEGLGIGFYEALQKRKPVLTLRTVPHQEIITEDVGWLLDPTALVPNAENDSSCVMSATIDVATLQDFFTDLGKLSCSQWETILSEKAARIDDLNRERALHFKGIFSHVLQLE